MIIWKIRTNYHMFYIAKSVAQAEFLRNTGIRAQIIQRFEILWISNTRNDILWFILFIILMGGGNWTKVVLISSITGYMCVIIKILGSMQRLTYWPSSSFNYWNVFICFCIDADLTNTEYHLEPNKHRMKYEDN